MNKHFVALALCLLPGLLTSQQAQGRKLRIGAWNLEQLGWREPARTPADLQALADFARGLGAAVLAVEEVGGEPALRDLCARMGPDWDCVLGTTGGIPDRPDRQIGVGFVWDRGAIELLQASELLELPRVVSGLPIFHRVPVSACFRDRRGGPDFRAIVVHLKAGRTEDDEKKREGEVAALRALLERLQQRPGEDQDVVVLGDFNHSYDSRPWQRFTQGGFAHYLRREPLQPTIVHFDTPIDQIAVLQGCREPIEASFTVHNEQAMKDKAAWHKTYTDHFPITVDLDAGPDDDPDATFAPVRPEHRLPAAARLAAANAPAAVTAVAPMPPPISAGRRVEVRVRDGGVFIGVLDQDLPISGTGWVVMVHEGRRIALPIMNVNVVKEL